MDRDELGATLRTWRGRLRPADVGLPAGTRRRTPGLRREEVAGLAGVSVDYLNRLEQGRAPHPSDAVLTALCRALRLDRPERDHLFRLAGAAPPAPGHIGNDVRPSVLRLMDRFTDLPAILLNARTDVLAWNPMGTALLGDFSAMPHRNVLRSRFLDRTSRIDTGWQSERDGHERAMVSDARRAAARYPDDPGLVALLDELRRGSETFARLWAERELTEHPSERKRFVHPDVGEIALECAALHVPADDQMLLVYSAAPGSPDADALALLRVVGTQDLGASAR